MKKIALAILTLLASPVLGFNPADFPNLKLKEFEAKQPNDGPGNKFATPVLPLAIEATTTLKFRPLSQTPKSFITMYESMLGDSLKQTGILTHYEEEVEIKEVASGRVLWVPIQKPLVPALKKEIKAGEPIKFFLRYFGSKDKQPIYLMVEFQALRTETTELPVLAFAKLCEMIGCANKNRQVLSPPLQFKIDAKFTGRTRPTGKDLEDFLSAYDESFPGTFQMTAAQLYQAFQKECEFEDAASKKKFWVPLQEHVIRKLAKSPVRIHAGAYGTRNGSIRMLGVDFVKSK